MMRYRTLGRSGLRVSELCLGTMTFGEDWGWGASAGEAARIFERFTEAGGNFIDTANSYTNGTSERILGELLSQDRDRFVVATKYTHARRLGDPNAGGNHRKNLVASLDGSLQRLRCEYVDLLWLHARDVLTPIEEVMRALDDQVAAGKIHYVGISDAPAWVAAHANTLAELRGWSPFIGLQVEYSLIQRSAERELLPMAGELGLGVLAWGPLGAGLLSGKYSVPAESGSRGRLDEVDMYAGVLNERTMAIARQVADVAAELGARPAQVALAWLLQRAQPVIPIVGARDVQQLSENLGALDVVLGGAHMQRLEDCSRIELGFPHEFLAAEPVRRLVYAGTWYAMNE